VFSENYVILNIPRNPFEYS